MKIRTNDNVKILRGKDRGKTGKILQVIHRKDNGQSYVVVEGANLRKKHLRAKRGEKGQILELAAPLHASAVMLIDPKSNKPTRVGYNVDAGKKRRIGKRSGELIEV